MRNNTIRHACALLAGLLLVSCSKSEEAPFYSETLEQLRGAKLTVGAFETAAAKPYAAEACARGSVEALDVLLCRFNDEAAAKQATGKAEAFVGGAVTGAVRHAGTLMLAIADRDKKDPTGKQVQRVLATFAGTEKDG
jgi:hypothetical protein